MAFTSFIYNSDKPVYASSISNFIYDEVELVYLERFKVFVVDPKNDRGRNDFYDAMIIVYALDHFDTINRLPNSHRNWRVIGTARFYI